MIERVDMGAHVGIHGYRRAAVADVLVHRFADLHRVGDHIAVGGVGHPHLVGRVTRSLPAGHTDKVLHRQVVGLGSIDPGHDRRLRLRGHQVQTPDLVLLPPGADTHFGLGQRVSAAERAEHRQNSEPGKIFNPRRQQHDMTPIRGSGHVIGC
ncbi:hypothetical protein D3C79_511800 [compost metagenome]